MTPKQYVCPLPKKVGPFVIGEVEVKVTCAVPTFVKQTCAGFVHGAVPTGGNGITVFVVPMTPYQKLGARTVPAT